MNMNMQIYLGWWAVPLAVTVGAFLIAFFNSTNESSDYGIDLSGVLFGGLALIVSLVAWLVYAFAT